VTAGARSFAAIGQWAADAGPDVLAGLGTTRGRPTSRLTGARSLRSALTYSTRFSARGCGQGPQRPTAGWCARSRYFNPRECDFAVSLGRLLRAADAGLAGHDPVIMIPIGRRARRPGRLNKRFQLIMPGAAFTSLTGQSHLSSSCARFGGRRLASGSRMR